jgi:hypothetical protein
MRRGLCAVALLAGFSAAAFGAVTISPAVIPNGTFNTNYSVQFTAVDPSFPRGSFIFDIFSGSLPGGLFLDSNTGLLSGRPTQVGVFTFTVIADNDVNSNTQTYTIQIFNSVSILNNTLPNGIVGNPYFVQMNAFDSANPSATFVWSLASSSGSLPPGLSLSSSTGVLSGIPQQVGAYFVTIVIASSRRRLPSRS